jgi:hypothetical protein
MTRSMRIILLTLAALYGGAEDAAAQAIRTPGEESGYRQYSQHEDIARFLSVLDQASPEMTVWVVGRTRDSSAYPAKELYAVVLSANGAVEPAELDRAKATVMITASQHGNEQSAKEAALRLIRDVAASDLKPLLATVNLVVMPQCNPFGNWADVRESETGLDMNRDHVKLESEGVRAIHRTFRAYMPEVTLDVHEKGDDYYRVSTGCVSNLNASPALSDLSRRTILAEVGDALARERVPFREYLVTEEMGLDTSAGARYRPEERAGRATLTRFSTPDLNDGRNSLGIYQTLSFIQEGASRHDLETLRDRTGWQYAGLRAFARSVAGNAATVVSLVGGLRARQAEDAQAPSERSLVHLRMEYVRDPAQPTLAIKRFARTETPIRGVLNADKKAGEPVAAGDLVPHPYPRDVKVVDEVIENWFPRVEPRLSVVRPRGYLLPGRLQEAVETLLRHGIRVWLLTRDQEVEAEAYDATEVSPARLDYLPPERIEVEARDLRTLARKGDFYVSCAQPGANLVAALLEPQSQYGLIRYSTYKLVPEKGDVFAVLRITKPQDLAVVPYRGWRE